MLVFDIDFRFVAAMLPLVFRRFRCFSLMPFMYTLLRLFRQRHTPLRYAAAAAMRRLLIMPCHCHDIDISLSAVS